MITVEPMTKVRIAAPKSRSYDVIDALYRLNLFHIKEYHRAKDDTGQEIEAGKPLIEAEELSKLLITLRAMKNSMGIVQTAEDVKPVSLTRQGFIQLKEKIESLYHKVSSLSAESAAQEKITTDAKESIRTLHAFEKLGIGQLPAFRRTALFVGKIKNGFDPAAKLPTNAYIYKETQLGNDLLAFIAVHIKDSAATEAALKDQGFTPLGAVGNLGDAAHRLSAAKKRYAEQKKALAETTEKNREFLLRQEYVIEEEIKKAELPLVFATTKRSFIAEGFLPSNQLEAVTSALTDATQGAVVVEEMHLHHDESVPVKLHNPKPVKSFEVLTRLYELPQYLEADPSLLLFLTFPLFFGIMLGDIGYGIVTLLLFHFLKKKFPSGKDFFNVLIFASIVSIIFGGVFGEVFGFEHVSAETGEKLCNLGICLHQEAIVHHGEEILVHSFPRVLSRMESKVNIFGFELLTVLLIGIIIGFIHLNFGLLVGFYNIWKAHGIQHAILEKLSWLVMETGLIISVMTFLKLLPLRIWVGPGIFGISLVMLYLGEGAKGIIEIPALFSNMLSYMRLGALGLASVSLAIVINENLAKPFLEKGGFFIIIAIIIMVLGHAINIALGILGPFLHSLRLHYVEFFSKFFHGGGMPYSPFGYQTNSGGE